MDEIAAMVDQILGETNKADMMEEDMGEEAEEGSEAMSGLVEGLTSDPTSEKQRAKHTTRQTPPEFVLSCTMPATQ